MYGDYGLYIQKKWANMGRDHSSLTTVANLNFSSRVALLELLLAVSFGEEEGRSKT